MELWIVRHGETFGNIEGVIQGQSFGELTDLGKEQAKKAGLRLKDISFKKMYCSDLHRTKQTMGEILPYHTTTPLEYTEEIRENNFGKYEGQTYIFLHQEIEKYGPFDRFTFLDTVETREQLITRANNFLLKLVKEYVCSTYEDKVDLRTVNQAEQIDGGLFNKMIKSGELIIKDSPATMQKILAVSHGGWIRELLNTLLWRINKKILEQYITKNTNVCVFRIYCKECNGVCSFHNTTTSCNHEMLISMEIVNDTTHLNE